MGILNGRFQHMVIAQELSCDNVKVELFDNAHLRYEIPWWDALTREEKLQELENLKPIQTTTSSNTTCVELHYLTVDLLNATDPTDEVVERLAVGRSTTAPAESDTSLNDPVDQVEVTEYSDNLDSLETKTFLGEGDGNVDTSVGESLDEVGLYAGGYFLNHSLLSQSIAKDNTKTATITVTLTFTAQ